MANASLKAESDGAESADTPLSSAANATMLCPGRNLPPIVRENTREEEVKKMRSAKNEIQELHAKEVGVGNPSEERASS